MNWMIVLAASILLTFLLPPLRQRLYTAAIMKMMRRMNFIPRVSETERAAIEAGTAWVEKEFFKGQPNLKTILNQPMPKLNDEEQRFLDQQTEKLCSMIDDWKIWKDREMPADVWDYIRREK